MFQPTSPNLQLYFFGYEAQAIEDGRIPSGSPAIGYIGHGERYQTDTDIPFFGHYTVIDAINNAGAAIAGSESDVYCNVPTGQSNANIQTSFEGNTIAYGAGTVLGLATFYGGIQNTGTGTVTNGYGFLASKNFNTGGGTLHNSYGFASADLEGVGDTLNAAFFADAQTPGDHNWAFYSAGGKSKFDTIVVSSHPPSSATDSGVAGTITWDSDYTYVCVATNTWKRSPLSTW